MNIEEHLAMVDEALLTLNNDLASAETEINILKTRCGDSEELIDLMITKLEEKYNG